MKQLKKISVIAICIIALSKFSSQAQNWKVSGNTFTSGTNKILGTLDCHNLRIVTNDTGRVDFVPGCSSSSGKSYTKFYNTDSLVFNVARAEFTNKLYVGGGEIGDEGGTMSIGRPSSIGSGVDGIKMKSFPGTGKSVLNVIVASSNQVQCLGLSVQAMPAAGFGTGINTVGGRVGLNGIADGGSVANGNVIGVKGYAKGINFPGTVRIGVNGKADTAAITYGIFGEAGASTNLTRAGYFSGDLQYTGSLIGPSDMQLKENVQPYSGALNKLKMVEIKSYNFKREYSFMHLPTGNQVGVISQQLETVFPELVEESVHPADYNVTTGEKISDEVRYKGVNYTGLIPVMIAGINEQQQQIDELKKYKNDIAKLKTENDELKNQIAEIKNSLSKITSSNIKNNENRTPSLEQNAPNPFNEKTDIKYFVPDGSVNAVVNIYSETHSLLKSYPAVTQGSGLITLDAGTLASGNYLYELVIDGTVAASKKMSIAR